MRRYVFVFLTAAVLLGAGAGISYAYLTGQAQQVNRFCGASTEIRIKEDFDPPDEIKPGGIIKKVPVIENVSDIPCYVRVSVRFSDSEAQKACEPLEMKAGWGEGADGWYYWDSALMPGKHTGPLFEQIRIRKDVKEDVPSFDVLVYAEAVCCGKKDPETAWREMNGN